MGEAVEAGIVVRTAIEHLPIKLLIMQISRHAIDGRVERDGMKQGGAVLLVPWQQILAIAGLRGGGFGCGKIPSLTM